eukprot:SAG22_NODE_474_length_10034_cov_21.356517_9_plen_45_part_00
MTGDKATDTRRGWRPAHLESWDRCGPEYDNPLVQMQKPKDAAKL